MIYIETNSTDAYYNFAVEYYFTTEKQFEETVFLFWRTTPTLMVGKYQNVLEEINKAYVDEQKMNIVRRMSGGGTIYTDMGGWQFTFIQENKEKIEFTDFIAPVVSAVRELGGDATFTGRNDLTIAGKKFSGNAQYRLGKKTVHHGSLLFSTDIEQMVKSTTVDEQKIISKSIKSVRERVTNISEHLDADLDVDTFKTCMITHIMNGSNKRYEITEEDHRRIKEIAEEKFRNWEAIYGKNPKFNIEREGRCAGGKMQFKMDIQKGIIKEASVYGDFFSTLTAQEIGNAIVGARYEKKEIKKFMLEHKLEDAVFKISINEMVDIIIG